MHEKVLNSEPLVKPPLVSIVVTTFNGSRFVNDTYNMLKKQSIQNFECLVVDDGSSDDTVTLYQNITDQDDRFKILSDKPRKNAGLAREYGVQNARGEFIAILDQDDLWHQDKLLLQVKALLQSPELDLCYTAHENFPDESSPALNEKSSPVKLITQRNILKNLCRGNFVACDSIMIRRSSELKIQGFRGHPKLKNREDYYSILRYASSGIIGKIDATLTFCRYHSRKKSLSSSERLVKADFFLAQLLGHEGHPISLVRAIEAQGFKSQARSLIDTKPTKSLKLLFSSMQAFPRLRTLTPTLLCCA